MRGEAGLPAFQGGNRITGLTLVGAVLSAQGLDKRESGDFNVQATAPSSQRGAPGSQRRS